MTDLYAVIGNPIGHTKSPLIHKAFAAQTGQDLDYISIEGTIGGFAGDVDAWRARGLRGLNITAPFKLMLSPMPTGFRRRPASPAPPIAWPSTAIMPTAIILTGAASCGILSSILACRSRAAVCSF